MSFLPDLPESDPLAAVVRAAVAGLGAPPVEAFAFDAIVRAVAAAVAGERGEVPAAAVVASGWVMRLS